MNAIQIHDHRLREREQFVEHISDVLQANQRVAAAALTSSYARHKTDGLSELNHV